MTDHQRLYRRFLRLYPREFREHYGDEMRRFFAEQLWDARSSGGRLAIAALWARTILDVAVTAPREHLARPALVREHVNGSAATIVEPQPPRPLRYVILGLAPLWVFLVEVATASNKALFVKPPEMLGLPLGVSVVAFALGLMAVGIVALRRTSSVRSGVAAILLLSAPATGLLLVATPLIEQMQNLRT
jgi:hypothetical protein